MNNENLKRGLATQFRAGEEQARIARAGGLASAEARREAKRKAERLALLLSLPVDAGDADLQAAAAVLGLSPDELTQEDMIDARAIIGAKKGNDRDRKYIADIMGWTRQQIDLTTDGQPLQFSIKQQVVHTRAEAEAILAARAAAEV